MTADIEIKEVGELGLSNFLRYLRDVQDNQTDNNYGIKFTREYSICKSILELFSSVESQEILLNDPTTRLPILSKFPSKSISFISEFDIDTYYLFDEYEKIWINGSKDPKSLTKDIMTIDKISEDRVEVSEFLEYRVLSDFLYYNNLDHRCWFAFKQLLKLKFNRYKTLVGGYILDELNYKYGAIFIALWNIRSKQVSDTTNTDQIIDGLELNLVSKITIQDISFVTDKEFSKTNFSVDSSEKPIYTKDGFYLFTTDGSDDFVYDFSECRKYKVIEGDLNQLNCNPVQ